MTTLSDIRASYEGERRESGLKDPWAHYVARPLSFYFAWLCIRWRVSANAVTMAGLTTGMAGCAFLAYGSYWSVVLGAVLVNVYGLSDYVDGAVARATGTESEYGARIDGASYLIMLALLFVAVGIGLREPVWIVLGVFASYTRVLRYAVTYQHRVEGEGATSNMAYRAGMAAIALREPMLIVCALAGVLYAFLAFYALMNACELAVVLGRVFKK